MRCLGTKSLTPLNPFRPGFPLPLFGQGCLVPGLQPLAKLFLPRLAHVTGLLSPEFERLAVAPGILLPAVPPCTFCLVSDLVSPLPFEDLWRVLAILLQSFRGHGSILIFLPPPTVEGRFRPAVPAITGSIPFKALRFPLVRPAVSEERQAVPRLLFAREFTSALRRRLSSDLALPVRVPEARAVPVLFRQTGMPIGFRAEALDAPVFLPFPVPGILPSVPVALDP